MMIMQGIANGMQSFGNNMQYAAQQRALNAQMMANSFQAQNMANAARWNEHWSMWRQAQTPIYHPLTIAIVSLIDEEDVIERILRHLRQEGVRVHCGTDPPGETTLDPWLDDHFPDYDTEPVVAFSAS